MSYSSEDSGSPTGNGGGSGGGRKFKGVRQRKWGKWVSEIRVPGSQERLWLGSFSTAEAAAVARDVAYYCLRKPSTLEGLNFPMVLPCVAVGAEEMSPRSIQKVASDAGMAVDAQMINASTYNNNSGSSTSPQSNDVQPRGSNTGGEALSISIEDYLFQ